MGLDVSKIEDPAILRAQQEFEIPVYGEPNYGISRVVLDASGRSHAFDGAVRTESCAGMFGATTLKGTQLTSPDSSHRDGEHDAIHRALHATATEIRALSDDLTRMADVMGGAQVSECSSNAERRTRPVPRDALSERLVARMDALSSAQGAVVAEAKKCAERQSADPNIVASMQSLRSDVTDMSRARISSSTQIVNFTCLFKAVARLDSELLVNTLDGYVDLVGDLEPESLVPLSDSSSSHQINDPLRVLVDFVRDIVSKRTLNVRERQAFVRVLLAAALARGTLSDVLLVVELLSETVANDAHQELSVDDESKEAGASAHCADSRSGLYDVVHSLVRFDRYCAKRESAAANEKNAEANKQRQQKKRSGGSPEATASRSVPRNPPQHGFLNADGSLILGPPVQNDSDDDDGGGGNPSEGEREEAIASEEATAASSSMPDATSPEAATGAGDNSHGLQPVPSPTLELDVSTDSAARSDIALMDLSDDVFRAMLPEEPLSTAMEYERSDQQRAPLSPSHSPARSRLLAGSTPQLLSFASAPRSSTTTESSPAALSSDIQLRSSADVKDMMQDAVEDVNEMETPKKPVPFVFTTGSDAISYIKSHLAFPEAQPNGGAEMDHSALPERCSSEIALTYLCACLDRLSRCVPLLDAGYVPGAKCPKKHVLKKFQTPRSGYGCDWACRRRFPEKTTMYSCRKCEHDVCQACMNKAVRSNFWKPMAMEMTAGVLTSLLSIMKTARQGFDALFGGLPLDAKLPDKYRSLMLCLMTTFRILKVHLNFIVAFRLSAVDLNLSQTVLDGLKDVLLSIVRSPADERRELPIAGLSDDEIKGGIMLVQEAAAQALAEGFIFFHSDVKEQVSYLRRFLSPKGKPLGILSNPRLETEVVFPKLLQELASFSGGANFVRLLKANNGNSTEVGETFMQLLKACHREGNAALQSARKAQDDAQSLPDHSSPDTLDVLKNLQVHLLSYAVERLSRKASDNSNFDAKKSPPTQKDTAAVEEEETDALVLEFLFEYVHELVDLSTELVEIARDLFEPSNLTIATGILKQTIVNKLALPMATALCASSLQSLVGSRASRGYHMLMCKLSSSKSISKLSAFVKSCDAVVQALASKVRKEEHTSITKTIRVKNWKTNPLARDSKQAVTIHGATHLWVKFDTAKCNTGSASEFLQLYQKPLNGIGWDRIGEKFHGSREAGTFPVEPVRIEGDTVLFHFVSNPASTKKSDKPKFAAEVSGEMPLSKMLLVSCEVPESAEKMTEDTKEAASGVSKEAAANTAKEATASTTKEAAGNTAKEAASTATAKVSLASVWTLELGSTAAWLLGAALGYRTLGGRDEHEEFVTRLWPNLLRGGFESARRADANSRPVDNLEDYKDEKDEKDQKADPEDEDRDAEEVRLLYPCFAHLESPATERQFLRDFIRAPSENGHVQHLIASLKKHGRTRFIQSSLVFQVEMASRGMFAVLLVHTGCVSAARDASVFRSHLLSKTEMELVHLWNRSTEVQTTIGSLTQSRPGFSLPKFMAGFLQRVAFALSLSASKASRKRWAVDKDMQELRDTLLKAPGLARHRSVASRSRAQRMVEMMRASFQSLARLQKSQHQRPGNLNNESAIVREVSNFLLCEDLDVNVARVGISLQSNRAKLRAQSLAIAKTLVDELRTPALAMGVTRHVISALTTQHSGSTVSTHDCAVVLDTAHFLSRLNSAGDQLRDDVSQAFFEMIAALLKRRRQKKIGEEMAILLFKVCSLALESHDLEHLHDLGIVGILESYISLDESSPEEQVQSPKQWSSRYSAWTLFRMLVYSLAFYSQTSPHGVGPKLATLRELVFRVIFAQISKLMALRESLPEEGVQPEDELSDWHTSTVAAAKVTKKKDVKRPPQRSWPCTACTYVNNASSTKCSVCDRPHETWKCGVCGYSNEMSDGKCECGEEKGASPPTEVHQAVHNTEGVFRDPAAEYDSLMRCANLADSSSKFHSQALADFGVENPMLLSKDGMICRSQVDLMVNQFLWIVARSASMPAVADMLASDNEWLEMLIRLSNDQNSSRPGVLLSAEIARLVLPRVHPQSIGAITSGAVTAESLVRDACVAIGTALLSSGHTSYGELIEGHKRESAASGALRLLKTLMQAEDWRNVVNTEIERCLDVMSFYSVVRACKNDDDLTPSESEALFRGCGALASLGGCIPPMAEGARVLVRSDDSPDPLSGVIVKLLPSSSVPLRSSSGGPPWKWALCDVLDTASKWVVGMIVDYKDGRYFITYPKWANKWDEWIPVNSSRICPLHTKTEHVKDPFKGDKGKNSYVTEYLKQVADGKAPVSPSADMPASANAGVSFALGVVTVQLDSGGLEVVSPEEIERLLLPHEVPLDSITSPKKIMQSILSFMSKIHCSVETASPSLCSLEFTRRCCYVLDAMFQRPEFVKKFAELDDRHILAEVALQPLKGSNARPDVFQLECRIRQQRSYRHTTLTPNGKASDEISGGELKSDVDEQLVNDLVSQEDADEDVHRKNAQEISSLVGWAEDSVLKSMANHFTSGNKRSSMSSINSAAPWVRDLLTEDTPNDTASDCATMKLNASRGKDRNLALILNARLNETPHGLLEPWGAAVGADRKLLDVTIRASTYAELPRREALAWLMRDTNHQLAVLTSRRALLRSLQVVDLQLLETPQVSQFVFLVARSCRHLIDPALRVSSAPESAITASSDSHPMKILGDAISRTMAGEAEHLGKTICMEMKDIVGGDWAMKCWSSFDKLAPLTHSLIESSMKQLLFCCLLSAPESSILKTTSDREDVCLLFSSMMSVEWVLHLILDYVTSFGSPLDELLDVSGFNKPATVPLAHVKCHDVSARSDSPAPTAGKRSALQRARPGASVLLPPACTGSSRGGSLTASRDHVKHKRVGAYFVAIQAFTPAMLNLLLEALKTDISRFKRARLLARVFRLSKDFDFCRAKLEYVTALRSSITLPVRQEKPAPLSMDGDWSDRDFQAVAYLQLVLEEQGYIEASTKVLEVQLKEWNFLQGKTCNDPDAIDIEKSDVAGMKKTCTDMGACAFFTTAVKKVKCRGGHTLANYTVPRVGFFCDGCRATIRAGDDASSCRRCDFDLCDACRSKQVSYGVLLKKPDASEIVDLPDADKRDGLWVLEEKTVKSLNWNAELHTVSALLRSLSASTSRHLPDAFARDVWTRARKWEAFKDTEKSVEQFHRMSSVFTRSHDRKLIELMNKHIEKLTDINENGKSGSDKENDLLKKLRPETIDFLDDPAFMQMSHIPKSLQQLRILTLLRFNVLVHLLLPILDIGVDPRLSFIAAGISQCRALLMTAVKDKYFSFVVAKTTHEPKPLRKMVTLDRISTRRSIARGKLAMADTNFIALYNQMKNELSQKKSFLVARHTQGWKTAFKDEGGEDAGGLYRDSVEIICEELQSKWVPLFVPCPNKRDNVGLNRDKWVPNTTYMQRKHARLYFFVGQLMGLAVRSRHAFPLDLPSIVWKSLVGAPIMRHDVTSVDYYAFKLIETIERSMENMTVDQILDDVLGDTVFATTDSSKQLRELCPNGLERQVTVANLNEFCDAFVKFRLNEFKIATDAIREGLASVVPLAAMSLLAWQELELKVCGKKALDVDLLEKMTTYKKGCSADDAHIKLFWRVLRERLDTEQQSKLLQFIWGRSRMPVREEDFKSNFRISTCPTAERGVRNKCTKMSDYLPIAHTCFFELELPEYDSMDAMYSKLMLAAEHCATIDRDHEVRNVAALLDSAGDDDGGVDGGFLSAGMLSDGESALPQADAHSPDANSAAGVDPPLALARQLSDVYVENFAVHASMLAPPPPAAAPVPVGSVLYSSVPADSRPARLVLSHVLLEESPAPALVPVPVRAHASAPATAPAPGPAASPAPAAPPPPAPAALVPAHAPSAATVPAHAPAAAAPACARAHAPTYVPAPAAPVSVGSVPCSSAPVSIGSLPDSSVSADSRPASPVSSHVSEEESPSVSRSDGDGADA